MLSLLTQKRSEHHHETRSQVHVDGLDVRYFRQGGVGRGHERGHRQHGGDAQRDPGRRRASVQPEAHPRYDDDEPAGNVDLDQVVAHRSDELDFASQSRIVTCVGRVSKYITISIRRVHRQKSNRVKKFCYILSFTLDRLYYNFLVN